MKYRKIIIVAFVIFAFAAVNQSIQAQATKENPKVSSGAELDEREVNKFVVLFIKALEETKDLNSVSSDFFVKDFKTRFTKDCATSAVDMAMCNKLDEAERYELNSTFFNVGYLGLMHAVGNWLETNDDTDIESDEDDIESVNSLFPPQVIGFIKNRKTLNAYFIGIEDEDDDNYGTKFEIEDIKVFREFVAELKSLTHTQGTFLNQRTPEQVAIYDQNIKRLRKQDYRYSARYCLKNCDGLPDNTGIFEIIHFPLGFKIIRENGSLRIFDLHIEIYN